MSIKTIVRREDENGINGEKPNLLGALLVFGAFVISIVAFPKYITKQEK